MIFVDENKCTLCGDCAEACPWQALSLRDAKLVIDRDLCAECGACMRLCPVGAIYEVEPAPVVAVDVNAEPILRADTTAVARLAKPARTSILASPPVAPLPVWVGVLPLTARFLGGLADWWLDRTDSPVARRGFRGGTLPATPPTGSLGNLIRNFI